MTRLLRLKVIFPVLLIVAFVAYLLVALIMVNEVTTPDARKPFDAHPADFGLTYEDVAFTPRNGDLKLEGWLITGSPRSPYLIFLHGIGSQRTDAEAVALASRLVHEAGYNVLLFDFRAHGASEGDRVTAGERERDDVLGAYDFLVNRGAAPGRVGLLGRCYGAGIALMAAALEPGISAVVADSTFASVEDRAAHEIGMRTPIPEALAPAFMPPARLFAKVLYGIDLSDLDPEHDVATLAYPVFIIHGEADTRIPISQARRVHAAAPAGSEIWTLPGVEHAQAFPTHPDEYAQRVRAYLASRFAGEASPSGAGR
jgi:pimeloyl-ACP methyl ester carboxylesterase